MKKLFFLATCLIASLALSAATQTLTLSQSQIYASGDPKTGYRDITIGDWKAHVIKNWHSKDTNDKYFLQIKKSTSSEPIYIQVPTVEGNITSITMVVSNANSAMSGGGSEATLFFSNSNLTAAAGTGVASGSGAASVTIDCSALSLNTGYITTDKGVRIWDIVVTYETSSTPKPEVTATDIILNTTSQSMMVSETFQLEATLTPADATTKVEWTSSNTEVATVSATGLITAIAAGEAIITAKAGELKAMATITVTAKEEPKDMGNTTVADFLAAKDDYNIYTLTGTVSNITNTAYGNFTLTDETGSILIYGCLTASGDKKQFATLDVEENDIITVKGSYNEYKGTAQVKDAIYVSHKKGSGTPTINTTVDVEKPAVRKVIENGQVYIIRDGVRYNALGAVVK